MIALVGIGWGVLLGLSAGGTVASLKRAEVPGGFLALILFIVQGIARGRIGSSGVGVAALIVWASIGTVLVALLYLSRQRGLFVVMVGVLLNLVVVLLNAAMPVAAPAGLADRASTAIEASSGFYTNASVATLATWLGDVMAMRIGGTVILISAGDLLLVVGAIVFIVDGMLRSSSQTVEDDA